ncbi:glycosyltransferase [Pedobacter sp.]|uniref:glycosyltransferase n=1 Tax=Pedobacter sp. TaxID=1411316 RepID=UPI003D7F3EBE
MMSLPPLLLAVVVLYKQSLSESLTIKSLQQNLDRNGSMLDLYIYDNSPEPQATAASFYWQSFHVYYHHDPQNPGVSKAYNAAARKAETLHKEWLLLLDQDTRFENDLLETFAAAIAKNPEIKLFAPYLKLKNDLGHESGLIFSPYRVKHQRGYPPGKILPGVHLLRQYSPVNSGMLVQLQLFKEVGGYNEKVKLDFSDFQFIDKVRPLSPLFFLIPAVGWQSYSNDEPSVEKQQERFKQYLQDALHANKHSLAARIGFFYAVTRHAIGLSVKMKDASFLTLYYRYYLYLLISSQHNLQDRQEMQNHQDQLELNYQHRESAQQKIQQQRLKSQLWLRPLEGAHHSVCMATYNGEKYIAAQIASILSQIGPQDELIIADDGSTDQTVAVIRSFKDPRIKLYQDYVFLDPIKNFEYALQQSSGECIFLADQDDIWLEGKYKQQLAQLEKYALVVSDSIIVNAQLEVLHPSFFEYFNSGPGIIKNIFRSSYYGSCMAFRRAVLEAALPFPDTKEIGHDLWLGLVAEFRFSVLFFRQPLVQYRRHDAVFTSEKVGKSRRSFTRKIYGRMVMIRELFKFLTRPKSV